MINDKKINENLKIITVTTAAKVLLIKVKHIFREMKTFYKNK